MVTKFEISLTDEANDYYETLKKDKARKVAYKAVGKALRLMGENLKHPSLETHEFNSKRT